MKKFFLYLLLLILLLLLVFILYPSPINSVAWQPPEAPKLTGKFAPNNLLKKATLLAEGQIYGPEDVDVDAEGRVYGCTQDGLIKRVLADGSVETWVETGGRPLGLHFDQQGNLIVADAFKGLLSIAADGNISVLTNSAEGVPFLFTDDLDIATDGKIYFTDASYKWDQKHYIDDLLETRPYGRFMVYDPETKQTTVLMHDLYFSNGVALSAHEDFVLINETWRYRVLRYWLKGEKQGTHDVFIDNLPGMPDGISGNRQGMFWIALPTPRLAAVDKMHPKPWLKNLSAKLPQSLKPKPIDIGFILGLNEAGEIIYNLQDSDGKHLKEITSVQQHNGFLYIGSLHNDRIGKFDLKLLPQAELKK